VGLIQMADQNTSCILCFEFWHFTAQKEISRMNKLNK
jgi:hypothetical protein